MSDTPATPETAAPTAEATPAPAPKPEAAAPAPAPAAPAPEKAAAPTPPPPPPAPKPPETPAPAPAAAAPAPTPVAEISKEEQEAIDAVLPPAFEPGLPMTYTDPNYKTFGQKVVYLRQHGTPAERTLIDQILAYREAMAPRKPIEGRTGGLHQQQLWFNIRNIIQNLKEETFTKSWNLLLEFVMFYRNDIFSARYINRFNEQMTIGKNAMKAFHAIINIMVLTANPATRTEGLKQVDMQASLESPEFSEEGRQRVMGFYGF